MPKSGNVKEVKSEDLGIDKKTDDVKSSFETDSALQLSLGAPPFISVPKDTSTSLEIAMEELNERLIPIVIRRVLPNGDYQNIPINHFK